MKILKRLCAVVLSGCLFLCGSGFSNEYKDMQTIELKSNPTTGWEWEAQIRAYNESENEEGCSECSAKRGDVEITHTFKADSKDDSICGAGGTDIFDIRGVKEGIVAVEFSLVKKADCRRVDNSKTIWATFCVNESKQIKINNFYNSDLCCVNKK